MQLKWDQGLASRGKLKGKKTFENAVEQTGQVVAPRSIDVRWADSTSEDTGAKISKKRRRTPATAAGGAIGHASSVKRTRRLGVRDMMALASIAPEVPSISISPSAPVPSILFKDNNARLFNHYLNHVAKVTVVSDTEKNPFKTIICPMSFESPLIMSNILAIAAANLANNIPEYGVIAYTHLHNAYAELKERLSDPKLALTEITLAGVLGQVSCQLHIGDVSNWRVHLTAARGIVNALGGPRAVLIQRPDFRFYIQHLAWLDTLAATTSSTKRIGESDYWDALLGSIQGHSNSYSMEDLMGCPEELLQIIAEMTRRFDDELFPTEIDLDSDITAKIVEIVDERNAESLARDQATRARLGLEYTEKLDALRPLSSPKTPSEALNEAFRIAAKIYLTYRIVHSTCWSKTLQALLRDALQILSLIPFKSQEEMALPWPLFIMGSICVYAKEQKVIRARYEVMTKYMGFGNIQRCMELLEEVWQGWQDAEVRSCPSRLAGKPWDEKELGRKRWEVSASDMICGCCC